MLMPSVGAFASIGVNPVVVLNFDRGAGCSPREGGSRSVGAGVGIGVPGAPIEGEITVDIADDGTITITLPGLGKSLGLYGSARVTFSCTACGRNKGAKLRACMTRATQAVENAVRNAMGQFLPGAGPQKVVVPGDPLSSDEPFPADEVEWTTPR